MCADVRIDARQLDDAVTTILEATGEREPTRGRTVHLCNAYTLSLAARDAEYRAILNASDLNLPDGMPLVWVARGLGLDEVQDRVYGPSLMQAVLEDDAPTRHFLYGGTTETLDRLEQHIAQTYPDAKVVGVESPPFRDLSPAELDDTAERIAAAGADVVWVGLGTPKQDRVVHDLARRVPATFVAIGAAFDFLAGTKPQAPGWMQDRGLEWLFRLGSEPRRLWKRYLVGNTVFLTTLVTRRPHVSR